MTGLGRARASRHTVLSAVVGLAAVTSCATGTPGIGEAEREADDVAASVEVADPVDERHEFCATLADGMSEFGAPGGDVSALDQIMMLMANVQRASDLFDELVPIAPDEIAGEVEAAVGAWNATLSSLETADGDPRGALGLLVLNALIAHDSASIVDVWALTNCDMPVFGLAATGAGTGPLCPWIGSPRARVTEVLAPDVSASALVELLALAQSNLLADTQAAADLTSAIDELDPPARYTLEAIGRLRWSDVDPATLLRDLDAAIADQCGESAGEDTINAALSYGPIPVADDRIEGIGSFWGNCRGDGVSFRTAPNFGYRYAYLADLTVAYLCGNEFAVVSIDTGHVAWHDGPSAGAEIADVGAVHFGGDLLAWIGLDNTPASGLDPATYTATLHTLNVHNGTRYDMNIGSGEGEHPAADEVITSVWFDRVALTRTSRVNPHTELVVRAGDTSEVLTYTPEHSERFEPVSNHGILLPSFGESVYIDLRSRDIVDAQALVRGGLGGTRPAATTNALCPDRLLLHSSIGIQPITRSGDALHSGRALTDIATDIVDPVLVRPDVIVGHGRGRRGIVALHAHTGEQLWSYDHQVVRRFTVSGGWILITNVSDQLVVVDPSTGQEATDLPPAIRQGIKDDRLGGHAIPNSDGATLTVYTDRDGSVIATDDLCPA